MSDEEEIGFDVTPRSSYLSISINTHGCHTGTWDEDENVRVGGEYPICSDIYDGNPLDFTPMVKTPTLETEVRHEAITI